MLDQSKLEAIFERSFKDDGDNYKACCPIHKEKTPSFYVHKELNIVNCFGCEVKGSLVALVEKYKNVSRQESLKLLGITFEGMTFPTKVVIEAPKYYPESWLAPFKKEIHKYVISRGFTVGTLKAAEVYYDSNTQRQVFPHRNREGKLLGAIGRSCREREPKWYFYWGYEKGRHLYRGFIHEVSNRVWLVEGVFDVLWLNQHGISAVCTLGSRPTRSQIEELKDYSDIVIAYDNDIAGGEGSKYLYRKLKRFASLSFPIWPKGVNDVMETDPTKLELVNVVQRQLILTANRSS